MAVYGNFKGTTQPGFTVGKTGAATIYGNPSSQPSSPSAGDTWLDTANTAIRVYDGTDWDNSNFIGHLEGYVEMEVVAGENLAKGDVVYVSGASGNVPEVSKALADSVTTMPAFGFAVQTINQGNTGFICTYGLLTGVDTSGFSAGDTLYVSSTVTGEVVNTAPSGEANRIQNIGKVVRSASGGSILVGGAGRFNATNALDEGNIFIGDVNGNSVTASLDTKIAQYINTNTNFLDNQLDSGEIYLGNSSQVAEKIELETAINALGYLKNVVEDATPQLGGNLDLNSNDITGSGNINTSGFITATGAVTGGTLTDGTATLSSGSLTGAVNGTFSGTVTGGTLTDGTASISSGAITGATDITASGTVDAGTVEFDNLSGTGTVSVTDILDDDTMGTASATTLATSESIKAYVDSQTGSPTLNGTGDSGAFSLSLGSDTMGVYGGTNLTSTGSGTNVTISMDADISLTSVTTSGNVDASNMSVSGDITASGDVTATNGTFSGSVTFGSGSGGTLSGLESITAESIVATNNIILNSYTVTNIIDDDTMATGNASTLSTTESIKAYVDAQVSAADLDFQGDSGTGAVDLDTQILDIAGGTGIETTASSQTLTVTLSNTAVTAGQYGGATQIPAITVDDQGRLTSASNVAFSTSWTLSGDSGSETVDSGDTVTVTGGTNITTAVTATDTVTINLDTTLTGMTAATFSGNVTAGTITDGTASLNAGSLTGAVNGTFSGTVDAGTVEFNNLSGTGAVSVTDIIDDDTMATASATTLATSESVKVYVDSSVGGVTLSGTGDSGAFTVDLDSQTFTVSGGTNITTTGSGQDVSVALDSAISLTSVTATGTVQGGTLTDGTASINSGAITGATNITATGTITGGTLTDGTASITGGNLTTTGTVSAGTLTDGTASFTSGALTGATTGSFSSTLTAGTLQTTTLTSGSNATAGTVTGDWTLTAGSTWEATYADLAEKYTTDGPYEAGTVMKFGGTAELTQSDTSNDFRVAGVISDAPAFTMNGGIEGQYLALAGRVPVKVVGTVRPGDLLVASDTAGHAVVNNNAASGTIIGKAITIDANGVCEALVTLM